MPRGRPAGADRQQHRRAGTGSIVTDPELRARIGEFYRRSFTAYRESRARGDRGSAREAGGDGRVSTSADWLAEHMGEVPVLVIACIFAGSRSCPAENQAGLWGSLLPAAWSYQLAARARGLGSAWTTLHLAYEREIAELLGVPPRDPPGRAAAHGVLHGRDVPPRPPRAAGHRAARRPLVTRSRTVPGRPAGSVRGAHPFGPADRDRVVAIRSRTGGLRGSPAPLVCTGIVAVTVTTAAHGSTPSGDQAVPPGELRTLTGLRIVAALWVVGFHFHFTALPGVAAVSQVLGPLVSAGRAGRRPLLRRLRLRDRPHPPRPARPGAAIRPPPRGSSGRGCAGCGRCTSSCCTCSGCGWWRSWCGGTAARSRSRRCSPSSASREWVRQLAGVQMWDHAYLDGASWVGPTWSLSAEWLAYLLFPVAALGFHRLRRLPAWVLLLAAAVALMTPDRARLSRRRARRTTRTAGSCARLRVRGGGAGLPGGAPDARRPRARVGRGRRRCRW